ncbi:hypothetical protein [Vibrio owensii]|uniref:hypothetical protein n=1 Tax=Vibrio owensii TaxID=696485 RepID=UPI0012D39010|nr:hypothetical protein [Vibrio owensii]
MVTEGEYTVSLYSGGNSNTSFDVVAGDAVEGIFIDAGKIVVNTLSDLHNQ